jgi:hypothetical protein
MKSLRTLREQFSTLDEKEMTKAQMKRREEIAQAMDDEDFKKRYGKDWMSVKMATATKQAMKEAIDDEGNMARGQLMKMAKQATSLAMIMHDDKQLDGWVQNKLTMASDYLDSVHDYLMNNVQDVDKMEEGEHLCAKHVYSDIFGEGVVLEAEHAEPDENGEIEWYTVQFDHGKETVFTEDVKIMHAEMHGNHKKKKMAEGPVDKMHYCATHVEHSILGQGECISEAHAEPDAQGNIEWYTVKFPSITQKVFTENLKIVKAESHMHSKKKKMSEEQVDEMSSKMKMKLGLYNKKNEALVGNQHKIDANKNNKIDAQDFAMLRAKAGKK